MYWSTVHNFKISRADKFLKAKKPGFVNPSNYFDIESEL